MVNRKWQNRGYRYQGPEEQHRIRLVVSMALIAVVLAFGTFGYRWIEGWRWLDALYMTVITITTVGFGEVNPLSRAGEIFTIILILSGVSTLAFAVSGLAETFFQRQMLSILGRGSMEKYIKDLKGHVVVCGYGRVGELVARELRRTQHDVLVVERNPKKADEVARDGMLVVQDDATDEEVLRKAGIDRAQALVAALGSDADNLMLTLTARELNKGLRIIVRAEGKGVDRKMTWAGADNVVSPQVTGAEHILQLLLRPSVLDFVEFITKEEDVRLELRRLEVSADSPFANQTLAEAHIRQKTGCMVLAIRREGKTLFDPKPDARLLPGDTLLAIGFSASGSEDKGSNG